MRLEKFEKEIRAKLKQRKFDRKEVAGVIAVLELMKEFNKNNAPEISGVSEQEIEDRIMELFMPSEKDMNHKKAGEKYYYNDKHRQRQL